MKNLLLYTIQIISLITGNLNAQKTSNQDNFSYVAKEEDGDLNNDKKLDKVVVEMDLKDETRPLRLQIFLFQPNNKTKKLVVSSTKIIESQYPKNKNGEHNGNTIPDFFIEDGNLQMLTDINDLKSRYTFKFQNGNFELINISRVIWDGKNKTSETEINLIKGTKIEFDQELDSDKILNKREKDTIEIRFFLLV
ncbi:hypothetical protein [Epilithonimonas sp.]|uniref:hypothetical protein n=1 Tax=Epilithonimonas sp. TaxID=2894511 RepID=UPI002FDE79C8